MARHLLTDWRHTLRGLRAAPAFTIMAALSIGLGIGANAAIFTLLDQVLLRPLPVKQPQELITLYIDGPGRALGWVKHGWSYPMYADFRDHNEVFSGMFTRYAEWMHLGADGRTERVMGELVSGSYFPTLGVRAAVGRLITEDDDRQRGGHPVAVLSHGFWQSRFSGDPTIVGRTIHLNRQPLTVIGVSDAGFEGTDFAESAQVRVPMMMKAQITHGWEALDDRNWRWVLPFARLKPGVSLEQAEAALQPYLRSVLEMEVQTNAFAGASAHARARFLEARLRLEPAARGRSEMRETLTGPLWMLMAVAAIVLAIASANVAGLLVTRAIARQREVAIRLALGASRSRVIQQLLIESLTLAVAGSIVGLVLATWGSQALLAFVPHDAGRIALSATPDARVLALTIGLALLSGVLFGLVPAWQATRPALTAALKGQANSVASGGSLRLRRMLVVCQVSLALLLMIGAGLFVRTLHNLTSARTGLDIERIVTFALSTRKNGDSPEAMHRFRQELLRRLQAAPGVSSAGLSAMPLFGSYGWTPRVTVEGYQPAPDEAMYVLTNAVSPGYFATLRQPLLAGRDFTEREARATNSAEGEPHASAAIVNQAFAIKYFGGAPAVGRRLGLASGPRSPANIAIIGVVADAVYDDLRRPAPPQIFFPYFETEHFTLIAYVKTMLAPEAMMQTLRETVRGIDPTLPLYDVQTLEARLQDRLSTERLVAHLSAVFGGLATTLAVVGLYGVMASGVARRTREIGVRMALGAREPDVVWMVLKEAIGLALIGVGVALPIALGLSRTVQHRLFGVSAMDPATVLGGVVLLVAVSLLAALVPALRAARVNPLRALRWE